MYYTHVRQFLFFLAILGSPLAVHANQIGLTPSSNKQSGVLPDGYDVIDFALGNGNWVPVVTLPAKPRDGAQVNIQTSASYDVAVNTSSTDLGIDQLTIARNVRYSFKYATAAKAWTLSGNLVRQLTPNGVGAKIPASTGEVTYYSMSDGNWTPSIELPVAANDGDIVVIKSDATYDSNIAPTGLLYASTTKIKRGDTYALIYLGDEKRWAINGAPVRELAAKDVAVAFPQPTSPRTLLKFSDGNFNWVIKLPAKAGDRDRITVYSSATYSAQIDGSHVDFAGTMQLNRGDLYQFLYVADKGRWEMVASPETAYQAKDIPGGVMPGMIRPRAVVHFADANWVRDLMLPPTKKAGDRVIVKTDATYAINVLADGGRSISAPVTKGETVAFIADANGAWQRETTTIDLLLVYSDKAAAKLGDGAMKARLSEAFAMTNDDLENSGSKFRFRTVAIRKMVAPAAWKTLGDPLSALRDDSVVQAWRNEFKADGIYYEGSEDGCGQAWLRASKYSMVASGSINCGTTVMRHELGHNMGLNHSEMGQTLPGTIMHGNYRPYYGTSARYSDDYGQPFTPANGTNEVGVMDGMAPAVANYY